MPRVASVDQIDWAIEAAALAADVDPRMILTRATRNPLFQVRRGMFWFFQDLGWSSVRIGRAMRRDHSTVLYTLRMPRPVVGELAYDVLNAVHRSWAMRCESKKIETIEESRRLMDLRIQAESSLIRAEAERIEQADRAELAKRMDRKIATVGNLIRVMPPNSRNLVAVEIWNGQRMMPTRREKVGDMLTVAHHKYVRYYRVTEAPAWMGTVVLVPISESDWNEATQRRLAA